MCVSFQAYLLRYINTQENRQAEENSTPYVISQERNITNFTPYENRRAKWNFLHVSVCLFFLVLLSSKKVYNRYRFTLLIVILAISQNTAKTVTTVRNVVIFKRMSLLSSLIFTKTELQLYFNSVCKQNCILSEKEVNLIHDSEKEWPLKQPPDKPEENVFCFRELIGTVTFRTILVDPFVVAPASSHQVVNKLSTGDNVSVDESMRYEMFRFRSFEHFPTENKPFRIRLAQAGFYYCGHEDKVICYCCKQHKDNWSAYDIPFHVHKIICPSCPFLTNNTAVNIPIAPIQGAGNTVLSSNGFASSSLVGAASEAIVSQKDEGTEIVSQMTEGNSKQPSGESHNNSSMLQTNQYSSAHNKAREQFVFQSLPVTNDQRNEENCQILRNSASGYSSATVANSGNLAFNELTTGCSQQKGK